jgi:3-oxoacyl-[acyl-carrier protein] reductase
MKILISGGSRGLGAELTRHFAALGHDVITFSRSAAGAFPAARGGITVYQGDVNDDQFLKQLLREHGDCNCLINNAGTAFDGVLATQSIESIDQLLRTNLRAALVLSKLFVREHLRRSTSGTIINISSIIAIRGYAGLAAYAATKAGLLGMTRSLARELGPKGFRVNAVLPGYFESEMSESLQPAQRDQIIRRTPLGRLATAADIAGAVAFLASEAAAFITGQCLVVDGGITC